MVHKLTVRLKHRCGMDRGQGDRIGTFFAWIADEVTDTTGTKAIGHFVITFFAWIVDKVDRC